MEHHLLGDNQQVLWVHLLLTVLDCGRDVSGCLQSPLDFSEPTDCGLELETKPDHPPLCCFPPRFLTAARMNLGHKVSTFQSITWLCIDTNHFYVLAKSCGLLNKVGFSSSFCF